MPTINQVHTSKFIDLTDVLIIYESSQMESKYFMDNKDELRKMYIQITFTMRWYSQPDSRINYEIIPPSTPYFEHKFYSHFRLLTFVLWFQLSVSASASNVQKL